MSEAVEGGIPEAVGNGHEPLRFFHLPPGHEAHQDPLDEIAKQDRRQVENAKHWKCAGACGVLVGVLGIGLAYLGYFSRPESVPMVQHVLVDQTGAVKMLGAPIPVMDYTPQEVEWVRMLRDFILHLRERGGTPHQLQMAWEWLQWHVCGPAATTQLPKLYDLEKPFDGGKVVRTVDRIHSIAPSDMAHHYTVMWTESTRIGVNPVQEATQSVSFRVARREVTKELHPANGLGLCVAQIGGLNP